MHERPKAARGSPHLLECVHVSRLNGRNVTPDGLGIPVPPAQRLQPGDGVRVEAGADGSGRHAADDRIRRHILRHDGARCDNGAVANGHTGEDDGLIADPDIVADDNIAVIVPRAGNGVRVRGQAHSSKKIGNG